VRVDCTGQAAVGRIALSGHVRLAVGSPVAGLVRSLALQGRAPVHRLDVVGGFAQGDTPAPTLVLPVREAALGLTARLASGERLAPLVLRLSADAAGKIELAAVDDLVPLRTAVARMVEAAEADESAALGAGPLRRRAVFAELAAALDGD
jgi:hypothetical protein